MAEEDRSLRSLHEEAEQKRITLENSYDNNSSAFQMNLLSAIQLYEQCHHITERISLFSPNESLEDIGTTNIKYLVLNYRLADLILRLTGENRKANLQQAQQRYERFLKMLDSYDILSKGDTSLLEQYQETPTSFSTASTSDPGARRDTKIRRFQEEKAMKQKLEYMRKNPSVLHNDDSAYRDLQLTEVTYCTHQTFQSLESIAQELQILALAPPSPPPDAAQRPSDARERADNAEGYSERLDPPLSHLQGRGPILDQQGKPMRPFTLTSKRQDFRNGVFRPDHSLPTMSIDEYLEEERKRGGMIDGGGPQSQAQPQVDEDDLDAADRETMKARDWDEFVEANPKGSGNTINRG